MSKTLVIAEKPSVGRDIAAALPGSFAKSEGYLESDEYVVSWAVGHLVGLAAPEAYDAKLKKWRYADLPIVPSKFKLTPNDDRAKKQLTVVHKLMRRDDVESIVNACDAGREGELIFAYTFETAKVDKPVERLWLNSMTKKLRSSEAFDHLRPGSEMRLLEEAARSRSEADWLVGMNATRAAIVRLRSAFDGAVSLGRVQTPTLAIVVRGGARDPSFVPEPYWLVEASFEATRDRRYSGRYLGGKRIAEDVANGVVRDCAGRPGEITKLEKKEEREAPQLLYDLTSLQRHANTLYGFSARRTLAAAQTPLRGAQGDHVSEDELPLPDERDDRRDQADGSPRRARTPPTRRARRTSRAREAPSRTSGQRQEGRGPPRDHPHPLRAQAREDEGGRDQDLRPRRPSLSGGLPP